MRRGRNWWRGNLYTFIFSIKDRADLKIFFKAFTEPLGDVVELVDLL
jgi:hypothetical protein